MVVWLPLARGASALAALTLAAAPLLAHDEPIVIGRLGASPAHLAFDGPADLLDGSEAIELQPGDGVFSGLWVHDEPSFATILEDRPDIDLLRLLPGHSVALRLAAADAPLRFFEPTGFSQILDGDGSTFVFPRDPNGDFEIHLMGASTAPGSFAATFQFTDPSGVHLDSERFTLRFQTVPTPTSILIPLFAVLAVSRRRRS